MSKPFKNCPCCQKSWVSQDEFLNDGALELIGYTPNFKKLVKGVFYFNHLIDRCNTTFTMQADDFMNLYQGPRYGGFQTDTEDCPGYCHDREQLDRCEAYCEAAFVREITDIIQVRQQASKK